MAFDRFTYQAGGERARETYYQQSFYTSFKLSLYIDRLLFGSDRPRIVNGLNVLGIACVERARYDEAERHFNESLAICQHLGSRGNSLRIETQFQLGTLRTLQGRFEEASKLFSEALRHAELGQFSSTTKTLLLINLAEVHRQLGRYSNAHRYLDRALTLSQIKTDDDINQGAHCLVLNNLAVLHLDEGKYNEAVPLLQRAVEITERLSPPHDPELALARINLSAALNSAGHLDDALAECALAMSIFDGPEDVKHQVGVIIWDHLGTLQLKCGEVEAAEKSLRTALVVAHEILPDSDNHPLMAASLQNLGYLLLTTGRLDEAELVIDNALAILERGHRNHANYSAALSASATVKLLKHGPEKAATLILDSAKATWSHLVGNFTAMPRDQQTDFIRHLKTFENGHMLNSFTFREEQPIDAEIALSWALLSKQLFFEADRRASDALQDIRSSANPAFQQLWADTEQLRQQYREAAMAPFHRNSVLEEQSETATLMAVKIDEAEQRLRNINPDYASLSRLGQVTVADVRGNLRPGDVLVEFVTFTDPLTPSGTEQYGALLLPHAGPVRAVPLGTVHEIDRLVRHFLEAMSEAVGHFPESIEVAPAVAAKAERLVNQLSAQLRRYVWEPLRLSIIGTQRAYIAAEGALSLMPFEALAHLENDRWKYLVEDGIEIVYVNTGRDVARFTEVRHKSNRTAMFLSDPDFDAKPEEIDAAMADIERSTKVIRSDLELLGAINPSPDLRRQIPRDWTRVPITGEIARSAQTRLQQAGWDVVSYAGKDALKERITGLLVAPRLLQISTHGYTLDSPKNKTATGESPLLRSMLFFAGANHWNAMTPSTRSDGILTAYEVTGLDLRGTELVNLTACETGRGKVTAEGVIGLRHAFFLAGSRAVTMSMWSIPTDATIAQMVDFYDRWLNEDHQITTTYGAFRESQLSALNRSRNNRRFGNTGHPLFWAGVVYSGDPGDASIAWRNDEI